MELEKPDINARPDALPNAEYNKDELKRPATQSFMPNLAPNETETKILRNALDKTRQSLPMPSFSTAPLDTFLSTQRVFAISFPHLFPYCRNG